MNNSRIFNEVGDLYEVSIINEGKSRFPVQADGIGKDTFEYQKEKKVVPAVSKGTKAYVQQDSGPDHKGAEVLIKANDTKNKKKVSIDDEESVFNPERFSGESPKKSVLTKKKKNVKKVVEGKINNSMTKSIFDKLYEAVINENDLPGDDNIEAHDAEALDLPVGDEEGEVTITLDRETAKKLHDVLMSVLGEEDMSAKDDMSAEGEDSEDNEDLSFEATELEEIKIPGASYVKDGKRHPWEVNGKNNVVGDETDKLVDGEEGDGEINKQEDSAGTSYGHALVNAKLGKPTPVTKGSNMVKTTQPNSRSSRNVGQVAFKK
jgi:hypothetical protein